MTRPSQAALLDPSSIWKLLHLNRRWRAPDAAGQWLPSCCVWCAVCVRQHRSLIDTHTPAHKHASTSAYKYTYIPAHQQTSTSAYRYTYTQAQQHAHSSTHQATDIHLEASEHAKLGIAVTDRVQEIMG